MGSRFYIYGAETPEQRGQFELDSFRNRSFVWHALFRGHISTSYLNEDQNVCHLSLPLAIARKRIAQSRDWVDHFARSGAAQFCERHGLGSDAHRVLRNLVSLCNVGTCLDVSTLIASVNDRFEFIQLDAWQPVFCEGSGTEAAIENFVRLTIDAGRILTSLRTGDFTGILDNLWLSSPLATEPQWKDEYLDMYASGWRVVLEHLADCNLYDLLDWVESDPNDPATW